MRTTDICKAGLVFGAAALALGGCGLGVDGNGQRATEVRSLEGFSAIDSAGGLDVQINQGDTFRVEVSIDSNLLDRVRTGVSGDTLTIDEEWIGDTLPGPHVIVTMPILRRASIFGSGGISVTGCCQAEPISLTIDGSGQLEFAGSVPRADVRISGSGDARLRGAAPGFNVTVEGSGAVDARDLDVTTADISISGSGDVAATVSGSARVSIAGSGSVDLFGGAVLERVDISGSGSVTRH